MQYGFPELAVTVVCEVDEIEDSSLVERMDEVAELLVLVKLGEVEAVEVVTLTLPKVEEVIAEGLAPPDCTT